MIVYYTDIQIYLVFPVILTIVKGVFNISVIFEGIAFKSV